MGSPRLVIGKSVRITMWRREQLPAPVWGEIVWASQSGDDADVQVFYGNPDASGLFWQCDWQLPLGGQPGDDEFKTFTVDQLPQYALRALTKYKLLKG
jgi:hypothetical protein